jgi:hypothetical protein
VSKFPCIAAASGRQKVTAVVLGQVPHDRAPSISAWLGYQFSNRGECPVAAGTDLTARYWPTASARSNYLELGDRKLLEARRAGCWRQGSLSAARNRTGLNSAV